MNASGEPRMDLEKLRELEAAATPGEWKLGPARSELGYFPGANRTVLDDRDVAVIGYWSGGRLGGGSRDADAAFIVAAVQLARTVLDAAAKMTGPECWTCGAPCGHGEGSQPETLDAAWKEAEAALPEGWRIEYVEWASPGYRAATSGHGEWFYGDGPTPAAALTALALRLKEHTDG